MCSLACLIRPRFSLPGYVVDWKYLVLLPLELFQAILPLPQALLHRGDKHTMSQNNVIPFSCYKSTFVARPLRGVYFGTC